MWGHCSALLRGFFDKNYIVITSGCSTAKTGVNGSINEPKRVGTVTVTYKHMCSSARHYPVIWNTI